MPSKWLLTAHTASRRLPRTLLKIIAATMLLLLLAIRVRAQSPVQVIPDKTSYNVGDEVRLRIVFPVGQKSSSLDLSAALRYAGESQLALNQARLELSLIPAHPEPLAVAKLWKVPFDAKTGRYEVDLVARDQQSQQVVFSLPNATSFAVHKKLVQIERVELDKTLYTSGDPVACRATLKNLTDRALGGLRVEFSDRYWPWIAPSSDRERPTIVPLAEGLSFPPGGEQEVGSDRAALAKEVKKPAVHQFAVVVWDRDRKNIYDIAFSPLVFIQPPGVEAPKPYPSQYVYPNLDAVNVSGYRQFYPSELNSAAIQFDRTHTMLVSGGEATVRFSVQNPTDQPWRGVSIRASLRGPGGAELANRRVAERADVSPPGSPLKKETTFAFPADASGIYRAQVEINDAEGKVLAMNSLELGVNPLPKSILIFCAHEDDEMAHTGIIRAAVENRIPLHVVYFTSGDAGSCDRYYQHSCGPAEALNFGALRMEEARAALGHLGVPRENIYFLGLPDGGSGKIWHDHVEPSDPYRSVLLASDHAPYEGLVRPNLPYARKAVVEVVKEVITRLRPEVIYTAHPPAEGHIDHMVNNYFVVKALQELLREGAVSPNLELRVDSVYDPKAHPSTPYHYQERVLHVSGEAMALAQEAGWFYQSQGGNRAEGNLRTFSQLPRKQAFRQVLDWKDHEGWNEKD